MAQRGMSQQEIRREVALGRLTPRGVRREVLRGLKREMELLRDVAGGLTILAAWVVATAVTVAVVWVVAQVARATLGMLLSA